LTNLLSTPPSHAGWEVWIRAFAGAWVHSRCRTRERKSPRTGRGDLERFRQVATRWPQAGGAGRATSVVRSSHSPVVPSPSCGAARGCFRVILPSRLIPRSRRSNLDHAARACSDGPGLELSGGQPVSKLTPCVVFPRSRWTFAHGSATHLRNRVANIASAPSVEESRGRGLHQRIRPGRREARSSPRREHHGRDQTALESELESTMNRIRS